MAQSTYRQYLQGLANQGDKGAGILLQVVGDDFGINRHTMALPEGSMFYSGGYVVERSRLPFLNEIYREHYGNDVTNRSTYRPRVLGATYAGGNIGGGGGSSASRDLIGRAYDTRIGGLRDLLDSLDPQRQSAEKQVNNLYNTGRLNIESARDRGLENLNQQSLKVENSRTRSLRDLAESLRGSQQAFSNRLGTFGAGDSSAADLGGFAFAKLGAQGKTDINMQTGESLGEIGVRTGDLESEVLNQLRELDTFKQNSMLSIADQFRATRQQILTDINTTQSEKLLALADLNERAVSSLSNLDSYTNQIAQNFSRVTPNSGPSFNSPAAQAAQGLSVGPVRNNFGLAVNPQGGAASGRSLQPAFSGINLQGSRRDLQAPSSITQLLQGGRRLNQEL